MANNLTPTFKHTNIEAPRLSTEGFMQLANVFGGITDDVERKKLLEEEKARQAILDSRATTEWDQKQADRTEKQGVDDMLKGVAANYNPNIGAAAGWLASNTGHRDRLNAEAQKELNNLVQLYGTEAIDDKTGESIIDKATGKPVKTLVGGIGSLLNNPNVSEEDRARIRDINALYSKAPGTREGEEARLTSMMVGRGADLATANATAKILASPVESLAERQKEENAKAKAKQELLEKQTTATEKRLSTLMTQFKPTAEQRNKKYSDIGSQFRAAVTFDDVKDFSTKDSNWFVKSSQADAFNAAKAKNTIAGKALGLAPNEMDKVTGYALSMAVTGDRKFDKDAFDAAYAEGAAKIKKGALGESLNSDYSKYVEKYKDLALSPIVTPDDIKAKDRADYMKAIDDFFGGGKPTKVGSKPTTIVPPKVGMPKQEQAKVVESPEQKAIRLQKEDALSAARWEDKILKEFQELDMYKKALDKKILNERAATYNILKDPKGSTAYYDAGPGPVRETIVNFVNNSRVNSMADNINQVLLLRDPEVAKNQLEFKLKGVSEKDKQSILSKANPKVRELLDLKEKERDPGFFNKLLNFKYTKNAME